MRLRPTLILWVITGSLWILPPASLAHSRHYRITMPVRESASSVDPPSNSSPDWWKEKRHRFQRLAVCGLASANVTYTLLVGFSGFGAAIPFAAALLGVVMCL